MNTNAHEPGDGGAAYSSKLLQQIMEHRAKKNTAIATPASSGARNCNNLKRNHPIVTAEKSSSAQSNALCSTVTCPDGSILKLSPGASTSILLGAGKHGIPSTASDYKCILHLVESATGHGYTTELVVIGSKSCRVTRAGNTFFAKSISQILATNDASPSHIIIRDGDIIEPYHQQGVYHPFRVNLSSASSGEATSPLNPNAKWLYDRCSTARLYMEYPHSTLHLATKILAELRQYYSSKRGGDDAQTIQDLVFKLIDAGKKRDVQFVFDITSKSLELWKDYGLTVDSLKDAAAASERSTSTLSPHNGMIEQTNDRVMDGSAFLEASRKIDEAAKYAGNAPSENVVERVHFDNESFRETFLEDPTNTTNFFISYYKSASKRVSNKSMFDNLLSTYADAISPLGNEKRKAPENMKGVDDFPLKEIFSLFIAANQLSFGKRVIEGYIWLSCQESWSRKKGYSGTYYDSHSHLVRVRNCL